MNHSPSLPVTHTPVTDSSTSNRPSTSTPHFSQINSTDEERMDTSPIKSESNPMDISPEHPFHKELIQINNDIFKNSSEKVGRRLSLLPMTCPDVSNSPVSTLKNKSYLTPIKESSPLTTSPSKLCAKKELSFSDNDDCASPKLDAKRRKTMSPSELHQPQKFKKSPRDGLKKFAHSSLRKSFKMKTHSLARWISSSDVCVKSSPRPSVKVVKTDMPPPAVPPPSTPSKPSDDLLHLSPSPRPSLGVSTEEDSQRMPMVHTFNSFLTYSFHCTDQGNTCNNILSLTIRLDQSSLSYSAFSMCRRVVWYLKLYVRQLY